MWRFEHPGYLWALVLVPVLWAMAYVSFRKEKAQYAAWGGFAKLSQLIPGFLPFRSAKQLVLISGAFLFGILALANVQAGLKTQKIKRKGIDVLLCLDVSNSMLATDLAPNRLERAKQWIGELLNEMPNNRVGLLVFAGNAYISVPLTHDHAALRVNLADVNPDQIPTQGTSLHKAMAMGRARFDPQEARFKSMVILTDGEDHDEDAITEAEACKEAGIVVACVGIGTPEGSRIPDPVNGGVKKDRAGKDIVSSLNEDLLKQVAQTTHGPYARLQERDPADLAKVLNNTNKGVYDEINTTEYDSYFTYFAVLSLLCLIAEQYLEKKRGSIALKKTYA